MLSQKMGFNHRLEIYPMSCYCSLDFIASVVSMLLVAATNGK